MAVESDLGDLIILDRTHHPAPRNKVNEDKHLSSSFPQYLSLLTYLSQAYLYYLIIIPGGRLKTLSMIRCSLFYNHRVKTLSFLVSPILVTL